MISLVAAVSFFHLPLVVLRALKTLRLQKQSTKIVEFLSTIASFFYSRCDNRSQTTDLKFNCSYIGESFPRSE